MAEDESRRKAEANVENFFPGGSRETDAAPAESSTAQDRKLLGSLIRSARKRRGVTAAQLGESLDPNVTESAVTSWERGRTMPSFQAIEQMDKILGVSLGDLLAARERTGVFPAEGGSLSERAALEARLLGFEQVLSMEGLEMLVEYAEFLAGRHRRDGSAE